MAEVLTHNQKFDSPQDALKHYGKKGMRWGVTTVDTQSGKHWTSSTQFQSTAQNMARAAHTRLDNVELNDEFLKRWVQNDD